VSTESALNHEPGSPCQVLDDIAAEAQEDTSVSTDEPSLGEVERAISKLRNGRAAGEDGISTELLKCAAVPITGVLHTLFLCVWRTGRVPAEWKDGIVVSLYKGKGIKSACSSYRPISLLSARKSICSCRPIACSVATVTGAHQATTSIRFLHVEDPPLTPSWHYAFSLRYIENSTIKGAFDSVDRVALWKALKGKGVPHLVLQLLEDLHSQRCVQAGSYQGVQYVIRRTPGCVLAPALFCIAIDWILSQVAPHVGITVGDQCFTDLAYADDAVIFLSDEDQAADCFSALSNAAAPFGLRISWTKTKEQNFGSGLPSSSLTVDGEIVVGVEEFVYLGSKQTSDGYCSLEIMRRIGLASALMSSLRKVWNNRQLCADTKVHIYRALVQSVLLYGSETWTLLASDIKKIEKFHLRCQRQLLWVSWRDHITNEAIGKQN